MKDGIIKGTGNSRLLKAPATIPATYAEFRNALISGTLPVDMIFNAAGWDVIGTLLGKSTLLTDAVAALYGLTGDNATVNKALEAILAEVTTSKKGLMSSGDKTKLDGVAANANNYVHPTTAGNKHIPTGGSVDSILGYSANGTAIWVQQLAIKALLEAANADAYGVTNADAALALLRPARHYGKRSQMSGGTAHSGDAGRGIMSFSAENVDDFNAINLATSTTRIVIPVGVTKAKFYFSSGAISAVNNECYIKLYKNGVEAFTLLFFSHYNESFLGAEMGATAYSPILDCTAGNYFEIFVGTSDTGQRTSTVGAGSMFGMEVFG